MEKLDEFLQDTNGRIRDGSAIPTFGGSEQKMVTVPYGVKVD